MQKTEPVRNKKLIAKSVRKIYLIDIKIPSLPIKNLCQFVAGFVKVQFSLPSVVQWVAVGMGFDLSGVEYD